MEGEQFGGTQMKSSKSFASQAEVNSLSKTHLQEIRVFMNPPAAVKVVVECVLKVQAGYNKQIALNVKGNFDYAEKEVWKHCSQALQNHGQLIQTCSDIFDHIGKDPVLDGHIRQAAKILTEKGLTLQKIKCVSLACFYLGVWLQEVVEYQAALNSKKA